MYNYVRVNVSLRGFYPIPLFCVRKVLLLLSCPVNADIVSSGLYISMWWPFIPVNHTYLQKVRMGPFSYFHSFYWQECGICSRLGCMSICCIYVICGILPLWLLLQNVELIASLREVIEMGAPANQGNIIRNHVDDSSKQSSPQVIYLCITIASPVY